jgi:hypothetical protein
MIEAEGEGFMCLNRSGLGMVPMLGKAQGQNHCQNSRQKDSIKGTSAADGGDWCP